MATEVVKIVDTGGSGDYSSLSAWEAGEQRDLVTADEIAVADCRCTTGAADTTAVTIEGWTTDSTRYIKIWTNPAQGYRHSGKWDITAYRIIVTNGSALRIMEEYTDVIGLQIDCTNKSSGSNGLFMDRDYIYISKCIVQNCERGLKPASSSTIAYMWNTIIINCWRAIDNDDDTSDTQYAYNITAIGSDYHGILRCVAKNCLCKGYTTCFFGLASNSDYNSSDDSTGDNWGSNGRANQTFTFVDEANGDYHLDVSDAGAKDYGIDLSSDLYLAFTDDIDGDTRSAPWDIGADEYIAAVGGSIIKIINETLNFNESVSRLSSTNKIVNETLQLDETYPKLQATNKIINETLELNENISRISGVIKVISETLQISELVTKIPGITKVVNETLQFSESIFRKTGITKVVNEALQIVENISKRSWTTKIVNEALNLSESVFKRGVVKKIVNETLQLSENVIRRSGLVRIINETLRISENIIRSLAVALGWREVLEADSLITLEESKKTAITLEKAEDSTITTEISDNSPLD